MRALWQAYTSHLCIHFMQCNAFETCLWPCCHFSFFLLAKKFLFLKIGFWQFGPIGWAGWYIPIFKQSRPIPGSFLRKHNAMTFIQLCIGKFRFKNEKKCIKSSTQKPQRSLKLAKKFSGIFYQQPAFPCADPKKDTDDLTIFLRFWDLRV
jgi:hypothetical protein